MGGHPRIQYQAENMMHMKHKGLRTATVAFRSVAGMYDSDDPWPEYARRLSDRAEEQIALSVEEQLTGFHPRHMPVLEVIIPVSDLTEDRKTSIPSAIRAHFFSRADETEREKHRTVRVGLREFRLTIAVCIPSFLGFVFASRFEHNPLALVVQNILVIFCWVVIWQPFQSLVFDRWTLSAQARVDRLISRMEITIVGRADISSPAPVSDLQKM
jgi:hypothetical protein